MPDPVQLILESLGTMFTGDDTARVLQAFVAARAAKGTTVSSEEAHRVINWAKETRVMGAMLDGILAGDILVDVCPAGVTFSLSPKGMDFAKGLIQKEGSPG